MRVRPTAPLRVRLVIDDPRLVGRIQSAGPKGVVGKLILLPKRPEPRRVE